VVLSLDPGGTEQLVLELATRLHPRVPMAVCCLDRAGAWAEALTARGVQVEALGRRPGLHPSLGHALARTIHEREIQVVHAHHYSPFVYSCLARVWRPGVSLVFTEHGRLSDAPPSLKRRAANQVLAPMATRVFAVSEDLKRHMTGEGFRAGAVGVIHNGIAVGPRPDDDARAAVRRDLGATADTVVIGAIARLDPVKDLGRLIQAVGRAAAAGWPLGTRPLLVIVGDGPERTRLETLAGLGSAGDAVRFLGYRSDARRWLAGFDIFVNSSTSEGVSLTILEAMAAGLPIIATRVGGTPEVIDDTCGRLVPARDSAALAEAMRDLAAAPETRRRLGDAARRRVESEFTIERMVQSYLDVYREVV
jgi:glycosyltransferase involved in cell wall biosynthesis